MAATDSTADPWLAALEREGREPVSFVVDLLRRRDLLLFDDGLHSAFEPFELYQRLLRTPEFADLLDYVFLEVIPINRQQALDDYLASPVDDPSLLLPAFQDDYTGAGLTYETYFDLLRTVRTVNASRPEADRIRVLAVSNPVSWCDLRTPRDIELFRRGLLGRDFDMYRIILDRFDAFRSGKKGIFLTNTRHAYTGVHDRDGKLFWNTGTFFRQWHPGKTDSIRIHTVTLLLEKEIPAESREGQTTEGMERFRHRWGRIQEGRWDAAFRAYGDRPVALPLAGTPFGKAPYVGNHMLQSAPDQTMSDAYDSLVFLAPLEELRQAARVGFIYTPAFRQEVARRFALLYTPEQLAAEIAEAGAADLGGLIDQLAAGRPTAPLPQIESLDPPSPAARSDPSRPESN